MTPDGYIKLNHELTFTNREIHRLSGQEFSNPPSNSNHCQWTRDVPQVLKDEALKVLLNIYGRADGLEPEYYRLCWYVTKQPRFFQVADMHSGTPLLRPKTGSLAHMVPVKIFPLLLVDLFMLGNSFQSLERTYWLCSMAPWTPIRFVNGPGTGSLRSNAAPVIPTVPGGI
jgi:hypothetical protein